MITWIASYPRSGNTLLRTILHQAFELKTCSIYNDEKDIAANRYLKSVTGHEDIDIQDPETLKILRGDSKMYFVKTHEGPLDDSPAIVLARNPYNSIVSHKRYLDHFSGNKNCDTFGIIYGHQTFFPNWGSFLDLWKPLDRPKTLFLKFEEVVADPNPAIQGIAEFIVRQPVRDWSSNFKEGKSAAPDFFNSSKVVPQLEGLDQESQLLIKRLYYDWMSKLGYLDEPNEEFPGLAQRHRAGFSHQWLIKKHHERALYAESASKARTKQVNELESRLKEQALSMQMLSDDLRQQLAENEARASRAACDLAIRDDQLRASEEQLWASEGQLRASEEQLQKTRHALNAQREVRSQLEARLDRITSSRIGRMMTKIGKI